MADYLTTDSELTSIANAIRTKGKTSAALVYPNGFISAIQAIGIYQSKNVTPTAASQVIVADSGYDALSSVTVIGDANLVAENIAENVTIFGIVGTYHGGPNIWRIVVQETILYLDRARVNQQTLNTDGSVTGTTLIL